MNNKQKIRLFYTSTLILTAIISIALALSFLTSFDSQSGYFKGGPLPMIFNVLSITQLALSLVCGFSLPKSFIYKTPDEIPKATGVALIGTALILLSTFNLLFENGMKSTVALIGCIGICSFGIYLLALSLTKSHKYNPLKQILIYLSAFLTISIFSKNNSNFTRHLNSVENTLCIIFFTAFLIYLLYEGRKLVNGTHSRFHLPAMMFASSTGISFSVAYIIAYLFGAVNESHRMFDAAAILLICIYILMEGKRFVSTVDVYSPIEWEELNTPIEENAESTPEDELPKNNQETE